jgi:HAMP domain-containing protein
MRSVLDTGGFIAFSPMRDGAVRAASAAVLSPDHAAPAPKSDRRVVVASALGDVPAGGESAGAARAIRSGVAAGHAAPGGQPAAPAPTSPSSALGWVVVVSLDISDMALPKNQALHVAWLLTVLAITVALATWAWHYTIFARPLETLAAAAERLTAGDHNAPITPERFDDIGALAMCLEVCRQAYLDGSERLAGAPRLRTILGEHTVVLPTIEA